MKRFEGKVAIVKGGNSGNDLAEARRPDGEGARVAITSPDKAKLDEAEVPIGGARGAQVSQPLPCRTQVELAAAVPYGP